MNDLVKATKRRSLVVRTVIGLGLALAFPFALLAGGVYLVGLSARLAWSQRAEPRPNSTPCGSLCSHAFWSEKHTHWGCNASRGHECPVARRAFTTRKDPNNCTMFGRR